MTHYIAKSYFIVCYKVGTLPNENSVSLQGNGTCIKPKIESGASYIPTVTRQSYVYAFMPYGTLKRIAGYGRNAAQMQLTAGRHLMMELKGAGWIGIKEMIGGAGQHITYYG